MLLPSAISCDSAQSAPLTRYQSSLFASPPLSPPPTSHSGLNGGLGLFSTCRALQSMLTTSHQLPSPPTTHSEIASPFKLRLRARKSVDNDAAALASRKRITKRTAPPPRGLNKRQRAVDDDMTRDIADSEDDDAVSHRKTSAGINEHPSTPKRLRLAPPVLPLGLERSDFHNLDLNVDKDEVIENMGADEREEMWSMEEDRMLVEMVLEKLKLSKNEWMDCSRNLGKRNVGRRWKSLMERGEIGLKRRAKLHQTWR